MQIALQRLYLKKRFPLAISRGIRHGGHNLFVSVTQDGVTGWGEVAPGKSEGAQTAADAQEILQEFFQGEVTRLPVQQLYDRACSEGIAPCALAGLDMALWDWLGKKLSCPLYKLLGLGKPDVPTSMTIGINAPEVLKQRVPLLLDGTGLRALKIKLGSPEGIEADQAIMRGIIEGARPYGVTLRVDANGGWGVDEALIMMRWLADSGVSYVEQPLREGMESELPRLFKGRPLPIYVDESCRAASDIKDWHDCVDGVNIKLMKCGGITGALRTVAVARSYGLKTMIGCMGESSISISAAAAITSLIDHIDLDSHLNLDPDPCSGANLIDGIIMPNDLPGHGARINHQENHDAEA